MFLKTGTKISLKNYVHKDIGIIVSQTNYFYMIRWRYSSGVSAELQHSKQAIKMDIQDGFIVALGNPSQIWSNLNV